eukprot:2831894-Rhodomonas_salina.1
MFGHVFDHEITCLVTCCGHLFGHVTRLGHVWWSRSHVWWSRGGHVYGHVQELPGISVLKISVMDKVALSLLSLFAAIYGGIAPDFGGIAPDFGGIAPDFGGSAPDFGGIFFFNCGGVSATYARCAAIFGRSAAIFGRSAAIFGRSAAVFVLSVACCFKRTCHFDSAVSCLPANPIFAVKTLLFTAANAAIF